MRLMLFLGLWIALSYYMFGRTAEVHEKANPFRDGFAAMNTAQANQPAANVYQLEGR